MDTCRSQLNLSVSQGRPMQYFSAKHIHVHYDYSNAFEMSTTKFCVVFVKSLELSCLYDATSSYNTIREIRIVCLYGTLKFKILTKIYYDLIVTS